MLALNRINYKRLNPKNCEDHLVMLHQQDAKLKSEDYTMFLPFRNVLEKLCELGLAAKDEVLYEDKIMQNEELLAKN